MATAWERKARSLRQLERDRWRVRITDALVVRTRKAIGESLAAELWSAGVALLGAGLTGTDFAFSERWMPMAVRQRQDARALRVLVVDDFQDAADSLALLLEAWGYASRVAYDGRSAFEAACDDRPDCLIADIKMPGMDGYTLADRVRHQPGLERTKLVCLSAYGDDGHRRRCREAGFDYVVLKPVDFDELQEMLAMMERVLQLAAQTEELSRKNVALAAETKSLMEEVKKDVQEVKDDVREMKDDIREALDRPKDDEIP
jgi:CheY-like chemotaxis protein